MKTELTPGEAVDEGFEYELKPGTKLLHGQYVIEQFLNNGGFGITYLAKDSLDRLVVIKECFPESICGRNNSTVRVRSRNQVEAFRTIVDLFIEEARSLARLSHPNIVGVHQVFEDNDTAYMAMDFVKGRDLLQIADSSEDFNPTALEQITIKLLDAVEFIHDVGVLHRDIAPDNILLSNENEPVLIDFGAARENLTEATSYLGSMRTVKDGYSPHEFYSNNSEQHPSSDLYSLAASLYHVMTKELPANAQHRLSAIAVGDDDPYVSVTERVTGYSEPFLRAIDSALSVFPKDRLQSAADWRAMITEPTTPEARRGSVSKPTLAVDNGNVIPVGEEGEAETHAAVQPDRPKPTRKVRPGATSKHKSAVSGILKGQADLSGLKKQPTAGKRLYFGAASLVLVGGVAVFLTYGDDVGQSVTAAPSETQVAGVSIVAPDDAAPASTVSRKVEQVPFFLDKTAEANAAASPDLEAPAPAPEITASAPASVTTSNGFTDPLADGPQTQDQALSTLEAAPAANVAAPLPSAATEVQEASSVISGKAVRFQVVADSADPTLVGSADGAIAEHLTPGLRVLSINDFPIGALSEFQRVVDATSDYSVGDTVEVSFGLEDPATGETFVRSVELPSLQRTMLLNGVSFETVKDGDAWATFVENGTGETASDLRVGDQIFALMPANELIDKEDGLSQVLKRELASGSTTFNFAVKRDGEMWLVSLSYTAEAAE